MIDRDVGGILWDSDRNKNKKLISSSYESTFLLENLTTSQLSGGAFVNSIFFELSDFGVYISSLSGHFVVFAIGEKYVSSHTFSVTYTGSATSISCYNPTFEQYGVVKSKNLIYGTTLGSYKSTSSSTNHPWARGYQLKITKDSDGKPVIHFTPLTFPTSSFTSLTVAATNEYAVFSGSSSSINHLYVITNHNSPNNIFDYTPSPWHGKSPVVIQGNYAVTINTDRTTSRTVYKFDLITKTASSSVYSMSTLTGGSSIYTHAEENATALFSDVYGKTFMLVTVFNSNSSSRAVSFLEINSNGQAIFKKLVSHASDIYPVKMSTIRDVNKYNRVLFHDDGIGHLIDLVNFRFIYTKKNISGGLLPIVNSEKIDLVAKSGSGSTLSNIYRFLKIGNRLLFMPWWTIDPLLSIFWVAEYNSKLYFFGSQNCFFAGDSTSSHVNECLSIDLNKDLSVALSI